MADRVADPSRGVSVRRARARAGRDGSRLRWLLAALLWCDVVAAEPEPDAQGMPPAPAEGAPPKVPSGASEDSPGGLAQALDALRGAMSGQAGEQDELAAFGMLEAGQPIRAREAAEAVLKARPGSFLAHLVLGRVQHEAEGSFPRALFHYERARELFEARHGDRPSGEAPWRWHAMLLKVLAQVHGDLEDYEKRLSFIARYNELYEPDMLAERAWPLMKLGRYREAKLAADHALTLDRVQQRMVAHNALCAIEFEAGRDGASYEACRMAVDAAKEAGRRVSSVDLTNLAEASRSLFKLDEAERVAMEATRVSASWYGNPWLDLAELYTRQGRFGEALSALREIPSYRAQRPPALRDADQNETRRALSAFLTVAGRAEEALVLTSQALHRPDRRGYSSRDANQDRVVAALLDRRVRLILAERIREDAAAEPFYVRWWARARAFAHRISAWHSGLMVERALADEARLVGTFRLGTAGAAIMPPWLIGELVQVLGPAVVRQAVAAAQEEDGRPSARAYYDAVLAEAALHDGSAREARALAQRSLAGLVDSEALLRARATAVSALSARQLGDARAAVGDWHAAFQLDPGVVRRLGAAVPVRIVALGGDVAADIADAIGNSPRFEGADAGMTVRVEADATRGKACLLGPSDDVLGCGEATRDADEDTDGLVHKVVRSLHDELFAPRLSLTRADINSIDRSNLIGRRALDEALAE